MFYVIGVVIVVLVIAGFFGFALISRARKRLASAFLVQRGGRSAFRSTGPMACWWTTLVAARRRVEGQPLGPRRRRRLSSVLLALSDADGGGLALWPRRRPEHGGAADPGDPGRVAAGSCQAHRRVAAGPGPRPDHAVRHRPHRQRIACPLEHVVGNGDADGRRQHLLRRGGEAGICFVQPSRFGARRRPRGLRHRCACVGGGAARRPRPAGVRRLGRCAGSRPLADFGAGSSSLRSPSSTATRRIARRRNGNGSVGDRLRQQRSGSWARSPSRTMSRRSAATTGPTARSAPSSFCCYGSI